MYSTNCAKRPSSSITMAWEILSSVAGRGSGFGGLILACSAGDSMGVSGDCVELIGNGGGVGAKEDLGWDEGVPVGENEVAD